MSEDRGATRFLVILALALGMAGVGCGCAVNGGDMTPGADPKTARLIRALEARGDADSLAAAAALDIGTSTEASARRITRIEHASALAPERADLVWTHISLCRKANPDQCDLGALEARLIQLDPKNGVGYLAAVDRAAKASDREALLRALQDVAESDRADLYWMSLSRSLTVAAVATHRVSETDALVQVIGVMAAWSVPPLQAISTSCRGASIEDPEWREVCRGVARAFTRGDTILMEGEGLAIAARVWDAGTPEGDAVRAAYRSLHYRAAALPKLEPKGMLSGGWSRQFLADLGAYPTEDDMDRARLKRAGIPLEPPADYQYR